MTPRGPVCERGVVAGNVYDKYATRNPIARWMMGRFLASFRELAALSGARSAHEVGCGEGHLALILAEIVPRVSASDLSSEILEIARRQAAGRDGPPVVFEQADVYDLDPERHGADLVVCCEVLEHLPDPRAALARLHQLACSRLLVSVPREPLWRLLNLARGRYVTSFGNTPGHLNHWSSRGFLRFVQSRFEVLEVRKPLPWTMALCRPKR